MRKVVLIVCSLLIVASMVVSSNIEASPFISVEGYISPYAGTNIDNLDGTTTFSQIDYTFVVTSDGGTGAEMDFLSLEFEADVFYSMGTISGIGDWTPSIYLDLLTNSSYQLASAGTTIGVGDSLIFSMLDVIVYTEALSDASFWQEGQVWSQSFFASDNFGGGDGGSTSLVPEPSTLLLLGSGLIGVAAYARRKKA